VINPKRKLAQLYFGGGTPTFLTPGQIRKLGALLRSHFQFAKELEASVEIDPRRLTREHLAALREIGFSRVSLGVQDFDSKVQQAIHRVQPYEQTKMVTDWVRELGFKSLNLDLMYGLPYQTLDTFAATLEEALTFSPDRLAVFNYAHVPWLKPAQKILEQHLPAAETKLILLKTVIERLTLSGYVYVGMDHFALPTDSLVLAQRNRTLQRNFQGYSTCGGADIFGIGLSSISQTPGAYWQNQKESKPYYEALDAGRSPMAKGYILSEDDKIRRETIMRLMCDLSLDYGQMSSKLGVDFVEYFAGELESLNDFEKDGLLVKTHLGFMVTEIGRLFIRNIAMQFDRTLASKKEERRFSKTV